MNRFRDLDNRAVSLKSTMTEAGGALMNQRGSAAKTGGPNYRTDAQPAQELFRRLSKLFQGESGLLPVCPGTCPRRGPEAPASSADCCCEFAPIIAVRVDYSRLPDTSARQQRTRRNPHSVLFLNRNAQRNDKEAINVPNTELLSESIIRVCHGRLKNADTTGFSRVVLQFPPKQPG
jgi:hypothetical protein